MTITREPLAREDFCRAEHARLAATLTLYTGDPDLGLELAQEALARACASWATVSTLDSPGAWACRVGFNLANSHFRRARYERLARQRSATAPPREDHPADQDVRRAVAALPRRQREAVVLRYLLDLSIAETAQRMGCADGTVRALTSQALAALRRSPALADLPERSDD